MRLACRSRAGAPSRAQGNAPSEVGTVDDVDDLDLDALVDVHCCRLGDQQATRGEEPGHPVQQSARIAADADAAVHEQDGVPATLAGQGVEDGAPRCLAPQPHGAVDGGLADVDAEDGPATGGEFRDQAPGAAADVQHGALTPVQYLQIDRVGVRAPAFDVEGQQPAVNAAQEQRATARTQGGGGGIGGGPGRGRRGHRCLAARYRVGRDANFP